MAGKISSIVEATGEKLAVEPIPFGEKIPDTHLRQVVMAVEDSREIISKFSPSYLAYQATRAAVKRRAQKFADIHYPGMPVEEVGFEDSLRGLYSKDALQYTAETVVDYSLTHAAIIRRSLLFMKRNEGNELLAAPGAIDLHPDLWKLLHLIKMPDIAVGATYSKSRRGGIDHVGKIIEAHVVEPRHVAWKDQQRPKSKRHKRRVPRLAGAVPGKLAANQA